MTSYAFWNNKGGVGKSFLSFVAATEYAHRNPDIDVYVIDLCPQANVSETLFGSYDTRAATFATKLECEPRATVAGYLEGRLNSPFRQLDDVSIFISNPYETNKHIPKNVKLIAGDNLLEVISEAIRQTSQLLIPTSAWRQVILWIYDLQNALRLFSGDRDAIFIIDCNPSFAVYTQLAIAASNFVVVPFTADDSSRRAMENVVALLYGVGDKHTSGYARLSFSRRAKEEGVATPLLHTFVSNRVTLYEGRASKAFAAASASIKRTMDELHKTRRTIFADPKEIPSKNFIEIPDYHSASIVSSMTGTPLHRLTAGPKALAGERIQINQDPLNRYRTALGQLIDRL